MYWICDVRWFPSMGCDCDICKAQTVALEWVIGRGPQWLLESRSQTPQFTHESQDLSRPKSTF